MQSVMSKISNTVEVTDLEVYIFFNSSKSFKNHRSVFFSLILFCNSNIIVKAKIQFLAFNLYSLFTLFYRFYL